MKNPFTDGRGDKCFGCSKANPHGLGLEFAEDGAGVVCRWRPDVRFQSWDGVLHGGITATILDETSRLVDAFLNGRNVTLFAPRRMGKTGLIKNAFHRMESVEKWKTGYVDVFSTQNQTDFTRLFASSVIGSMDSSVDKALKAATRFFTHFRPSVSIDPVTGSQSYSFGLEQGNVEAAVRERLAAPSACEEVPSRIDREHPYYRLYVGNYIVFYCVIGKVMELRRFLYKGRNWKIQI